MVPQLIQGAPQQAAFAAASSSQPLRPKLAVLLTANTAETLQEQARIAKENVPGARRIYVDLAKDAGEGYDVNWKKVRVQRWRWLSAGS